MVSAWDICVSPALSLAGVDRRDHLVGRGVLTNLLLVRISAFLFEEEKCLHSKAEPAVSFGDAVQCVLFYWTCFFLKH